MSIQQLCSRVGNAFAASASLFAVLVLATAPAEGQTSRAPPTDPEANAGAKLTAYLKSAGMPATNVAGARQLFIDKYCADCHNSIDVAGSLDLSLYETETLGPDSEIWEKVSRKLRGGMMPPSNATTRPAPAQAKIFAASVEQALDQYDRSHYKLPATTITRLNRTEYANAVRDILGTDVDTAALLPPDDTGAGFDNISEMLVVSPALVDGFIAAAMRVSRDAVGDLGMEAVRVPMQATGQIDGLPLGSRGGMIGEYFFPLDASYDISIASGVLGARGPFGAGGGAPGGGRGEAPTSRTVVIVDGKPIQVNNPARFTLALTAGKHTIGAALVDLRRQGNADGIYGARNDAPVVTGITVNGPNKPTGRGNTPSRAQLFICKPASAAEENACATKIFAQLATRAYRRPVSATESAVLQPLLAAYNQGRKQGDFDVGIQYGVARVLVDPRFLFRLEADPAKAVAGRAYRVSDLELASRLSFFLWSSVPDEELRGVAAAGRLSRPAELRKQVNRMLADPKANALSENFAAQWLLLRSLATATPDDPEFDNGLRRAMKDETQMLFDSVLRENRPVTTLLNADYTFLNDRLARHYGIPGVRGNEMRRVSLPANSPRSGLIGQASVLTVTSTADRTSPVTRGKWVLENLLGLPVPTPPPGVETNLDVSVHLTGPATLRKRLEAHREQPSCRSCHAVIDPIGFALEPFDKIGRLRTEDGGLPIDAAGTLMDGTKVNGPVELREALVQDGNVFLVSFTEKLLTYALGRPMTHADQPTVRDIVRRSSADQFRLSTLVMNIIESVPFQQRVATGISAAPGSPQMASNRQD
jgi:hypothetical protein